MNLKTCLFSALGIFGLAFVGVSVMASTGCAADAPPMAVDVGAVGFEVATGPCGPNGTKRACHVNLGQHDGVLDCFVGSQECKDGLWSACGGDDVSLVSTEESELKAQAAERAGSDKSFGTGISPKTFSETGNPLCASDPCNPYCKAIGDTDAGKQAEGGTTVAYTYSSSEWGNAPPGFAGKQDCSPSCGGGFPKDCNGSPTHYNKFDACQADHHCNEATGNCDKNQAPADWKWPVATCAGIDLTVGPGCSESSAEGFDICNRGNTAMTVAQGPIKVYIANGNAYDFDDGGQCMSKPASCSIALTSPLKPGYCRRVTEAECPAWGNGNTVAYVNSDQSIPECGGKTSGIGATAPGCNNNWSDVKKGGSTCVAATIGAFVPSTINQSFTATCPTGSRPSWNKLVYDATVPTGTSITFAARVTDTLLDGGVGASWPSATTYSTITTANTTKNCAMSGPAGCPIDLYTAFNGGVGSNPPAFYETISMRITINPDAAGLITPTLKSWAVSYTCKPVE